MRRTYRTLNDYEMQHNAEVGLFTRPSIFSSAAAVLSVRDYRSEAQTFEYAEKDMSMDNFYL